MERPDNPKPYDQAFKSLSDADPRGLLDVLGVLPESVAAEVEALPRDLSMRPLAIDAGYFIRPAASESFIAVFEALSSWKSEIGARLASYGSGLGDRYRLPVRMYVFPLARHACPRNPPKQGKARWGDVDVKTRLRWILPWQLDARLVLEKRSATLDPWAILFRLTEPDLREIIDRLKSRPDDAALFRILGGMRYRKSGRDWMTLLGRIENMLTRETMRESLAVQEWLEEGRSEGRSEGQRSALLKILAKRFPREEWTRALDLIVKPERLEELIDDAMSARSAAAIRTKIEAAAKAENNQASR